MKDQDEIIAFIRHYAFGMLLCNGAGVPLVTHLPFVVKTNAGSLQLSAHIAKANPQWPLLDGQECLLVFNGPHAYVSPSWYQNPVNVPTWNYTTVHVRALCTLRQEADLKEALIRATIDFYEPGFREHYDGLDQRYKTAMYEEIVGLDFEVLNVEATFKLNQNKPRQDVAGVIAELENSQDTMHRELAAMMKRWNP